MKKRKREKNVISSESGVAKELQSVRAEKICCQTKIQCSGIFLSHFNIYIIMGNLLYIIAVILIILWLIGFVGYGAGGGLIHILLVIAVIAIILRIIQGRRPL